MPPNTFESYLNTPLGFAIFFLTLWCGISFIISIAGGWFTLSSRFKREQEPYGEVRNAGPFFYTVLMRLRIRYANVLRFTAAEDALYVSINFLFRIGHPPLRIPWEEIKMRRTKFLWLRFVQLTLGSTEQIPMRISERLARNLGILSRVPEESTPPA